jgi:hypothetical protein
MRARGGPNGAGGPPASAGAVTSHQRSGRAPRAPAMSARAATLWRMRRQPAASIENYIWVFPQGEHLTGPNAQHVLAPQDSERFQASSVVGHQPRRQRLARARSRTSQCQGASAASRRPSVPMARLPLVAALAVAMLLSAATALPIAPALDTLVDRKVTKQYGAGSKKVKRPSPAASPELGDAFASPEIGDASASPEVEVALASPGADDGESVASPETVAPVLLGVYPFVPIAPARDANGNYIEVRARRPLVPRSFRSTERLTYVSPLPPGARTLGRMVQFALDRGVATAPAPSRGPDRSTSSRSTRLSPHGTPYPPPPCTKTVRAKRGPGLGRQLCDGLAPSGAPWTVYSSRM